MSTFPFRAAREDLRYFREIDNHYHLQLLAETGQQLENYTKLLVSVQGKQADAALKLLDEQHETNSISRESLDVISRGLTYENQALENLAELETQTTEAVKSLSHIVACGLRRLSQQMAQQRQMQDEIMHVVRRPYETKALELRQKADELLPLGAKAEGRDRDENFKYAMRLLRKTVENPIGEGDYITHFQIGWLLWIHEKKPREAEEEFYYAQLYSAPTGNVWHVNALRHMAEMQYLQDKHEEACATIQKALSIEHDYNLLFDAARYAARANRQADYITFLTECIELQPITIGTMLGEPDFQATQASRVAILQLADRKTHEARGAVTKSLKHWRLLLALVDHVELAGELRIPLAQSAAELTIMEAETENADYLNLIVMGANVSAAIEQTENAAKRTLQSKIEEIDSLARKAHTELHEVTQSVEHRLSELRREKELAEWAASRAQDSLTLPAKPDLISEKKENTTKSGFGCLFVIVFMLSMVAVKLVSVLVGVKYGEVVAMDVLGCLLLFVGLSFLWWLTAPFIALWQWHSTCNRLKHQATTEAMNRLNAINTQYPEKLKAIAAIRETQLPQLEAHWKEILARSKKMEEILEFFQRGSVLAAVGQPLEG